MDLKTAEQYLRWFKMSGYEQTSLERASQQVDEVGELNVLQAVCDD